MRSRSFRFMPRRPSRRPVRLACEIVRERDFKLISSEIVELSASGLLVRPETRVLTGDELLVSFMAPFSRIYIDAEAVVARVIHGRRMTDHGHAIGIAFDNIDACSRALIERQLADLPEMTARHRSSRLFS
jgi:hypothetical protein